MLLEAFALIGGGVLGVGDGGNGGREFCDKNIESVLLSIGRGQEEEELSKSFEKISKWTFV